MTIKTQGGKVITKGGKVSCECCEEEVCCMYPAESLDAGGNIGYSASDLPDAVTVDGVSFDRIGTSYGDTTNGVIFENGIWAKYSNGVRFERLCLIQGGVVDQFADCYKYIRGSGETLSMNRSSLCSWNAVDSRGFPVRLIFDSFLDDDGNPTSEFTRFGWFLQVNSYPFPEPEPPEDVSGYKVGAKNSPVGQYADFSSFVFANVVEC